MSVMSPEPGLPSIPSAGRLSTQNLYPQGTPAMQRLEVSSPIVGPATGNQRYVYMGEAMSEPRWPGFPYKTNVKQPQKVDRLVPISDARYMMDTLAPEAKQKLYDTATRYYGGAQWEQSWLDNVWERAINVSANSYAYANKKVDPVTAFEMIVGDLERSGARPAGAGGGGGVAGPTTTRQVSESINLTDPGTARTLLKNSLTEYLGRDATDKEQQAFLRALNAAEEGAPTVTEAVTTTTPGRGTSMVRSRTRTTGGFNPSTFAQEYAQGQEGAAEYQAATSLLDTFIGTLRARV